MRLTPRETDKLLLHLAGNLAKERRSRGVKLNYPETIAYISSEIAEMARGGKTYAGRPKAALRRRRDGRRG